MLLRFVLLLTIVCSLAVCGLNIFHVKKHLINLRTDLEQQTLSRQSAENDLARTKSDLDKTYSVLAQARRELEAANASNLKAVAEIAAQNQQLAELSARAAELTIKLDEAEALLAGFQQAGLGPMQVVEAVQQIKDLEEALARANDQNRRIITKGPGVMLPPNLTGKVLISDPKWHFVVLNAGEEQGVVERGELFVSRHGQLVARIKVSKVEKDRCVANIVSGWEMAEVMEGDEVIPANRGS